MLRKRSSDDQPDGMTESVHPAASDTLPSFITPPGETDVLMVVMAVILVLAVLMFGIIYFRLHSLPERMAHRSQKIQFEIVAVLGLISLFTHMHIFWIAGLLLALIELPDFGTPLSRIAGSRENSWYTAGRKHGRAAWNRLYRHRSQRRDWSTAKDLRGQPSR